MACTILRHRHTIQGRENDQITLLPNKSARKDNLFSHQRVRTSELALNRKQNASEAQLSQVEENQSSEKKLNILPSLNGSSHISYQLHLPHIQDNKT